jgi:hypothetical protein
MLAAAVLASWWAQAEPAPASAPPAAPPAAPLVAQPPAPAAPSDNALGIYGGWGRRVGSTADAVGPANGFSFGGSYERRYLVLPHGFELGGALDFFYDKFQMDVVGSAMVAPGQEQTFTGQRIISEASFVALQTAAWRHGRARPFVGLGFGFTVAYFSSPELIFRPGSFDATQPLARGVAGFQVAITHDIAVALRAGYSLVFTRPTYTPSTTSYSFLGDFFDADVGVVLGF